MTKLIFMLEGLLAAWLAWRGLYPGFYYLADMVALALLWAGVGVVVAVALASKPRRIFKSMLEWSSFVGVACIMTLLIAFKVPLRAGFLTARTELSALAESRAEADTVLEADTRIGLYTFSAADTNRRYRSGVDAGRYLVFFLAGDQSEAAFIHSARGIDGLVYNHGKAGHLFGSWYWMKQD